MGLFQLSTGARPTQFGRVFPPDESWLAGVAPEPALAPDLPIVDAHHHLWDAPASRYLVREFAADIASGHNIVKTVYVESGAMQRNTGAQALRPVGEVAFAAGMAAMSESGQYGHARIVAAIVAHADLRLGEDVSSVLEAHQYASGGRLRGVRFATGWDRDPAIGNSHDWTRPGLLNEPAVQAGLRCLVAAGLSFDAWVFYSQLDELIALADSHPNLPIVVGHCGGPLGYGPYRGKQDEIFAPWRTHIRALSERGNVSIKLGGMMMRLAAYDYLRSAVPADSETLAELWRPYIETCIEHFGPDRCMFESNFPVEKMGVHYSTLWNTFKRITAQASADEQRALFAGTASRFYRI